MNLAIGLALALASALALNAGFYVQHGATNALPPLSIRRPLTSLRALFTDLRWLAGYAAGMLGWGLYIVALRFAPLSIVQAVAAGGVGLLALLVWRVGGVALVPRERVGVAAAVAGLVALAASLGAGVPRASAAGWSPVAVWVAASAALATLAAFPAARALAPGAGLAAAAGLLYAAGDVATKAAVGGAGIWFVPVLLACHGLAFVALQLAFQRGTALATAGLSALLNNALPIAAGVALFHEGLPGGGSGALRAVGFAGAVAGAALLARSGEARDRAAEGTLSHVGGSSGVSPATLPQSDGRWQEGLTP